MPKNKVFAMKPLRATLALLFLMPAVSYAALYEGMERDVCFKNQSNIHIAYDCLSKTAESSHALDNIIAETNKQIKINNPVRSSAAKIRN